MWISIKNLDQVIWLAGKWKWAWHLNLFNITRVKSLLYFSFQSSFLRPTSPGDNVHSITGTTSGLGTSINSSWDPDNIVDTVMHYRNQSDSATNGYLGNSFTGGSMGDSIDLFREKGDTGSESSFGGDDFDACWAHLSYSKCVWWHKHLHNKPDVLNHSQCIHSNLMLSTLGIYFSRWHFVIFSLFFPQKIDFDIRCKLSPKHGIWKSVFLKKWETMSLVCHLLNLTRGWWRLIHVLCQKMYLLLAAGMNRCGKMTLSYSSVGNVLHVFMFSKFHNK